MQQVITKAALVVKKHQAGALYSQSENVVVNLPQSELGVGQSAKTLIGNVEDGKIEKIIVDPVFKRNRI